MIRSITSIDGTLVVTFSSRMIDASIAPLVRDALIERADEAHRGMALDFRNVDFIDSSGVGALVAVLKRVRGRIALFGCQPIVKQVLALTHLNKVFRVVETQEAALEALSTLDPDTPDRSDDSIIKRALNQ